MFQDKLFISGFGISTLENLQIPETEFLKVLSNLVAVSI